jgi:hypothetical protein
MQCRRTSELGTIKPNASLCSSEERNTACIAGGRADGRNGWTAQVGCAGHPMLERPVSLCRGAPRSLYFPRMLRWQRRACRSHHPRASSATATGGRACGRAQGAEELTGSLRGGTAAVQELNDTYSTRCTHRRNERAFVHSKRGCLLLVACARCRSVCLTQPAASPATPPTRPPPDATRFWGAGAAVDMVDWCGEGETRTLQASKGTAGGEQSSAATKERVSHTQAEERRGEQSSGRAHRARQKHSAG